MPAVKRLDADGLARAIRAYRDALRDHREWINRLNVYPVPDGDTGTNMALTLESVCTHLDAAAGAGDGAGPGRLDMAATCAAMSHGSLMGARGNSGVILSQVLRGLSEVLRAHDQVDGETLAAALGVAAEGAYAAVMRPVEGTILTVVREAAEAAAASVDQGAVGVVEIAERARDAAAGALARTPELLAVLRQAGVVDAGGAGFVLFLDAILHVLDGRPLPEPPELAPVDGTGTDSAALGPGTGSATQGAGGIGRAHDAGAVGALRYEVMFLLDAPEATIPAFKEAWAGIGDSIVVVGGDDLWNCHIHTDEIGAAIEAALDCGRPRDIRVTDLTEQVEEERWVHEAASVAPVEAPPQAEHPVRTAVVAVASGDGVARIFYSLGAQRIVTGGQSMNPSTAQLLDAVEAAPGDEVVILANNPNIVAVAEQVDAHTDKAVRVVPSRGITEGFAALLAYDPGAGVETNVDTMAAAASSVVAGEVTRAVRDATSGAGPIRRGDFLGLARDGIRAVDASLAGAAVVLLDHLVTDDHEIVTVILGQGSTAADTRRITEWLAKHKANVCVETHHGGQPLYPYLFGVE